MSTEETPKHIQTYFERIYMRAVVFSQFAEQSLPIPEVRGSNADNGKFYRTFIYCQLYCIEKTKTKEKEVGNGPFFKI